MASLAKRRRTSGLNSTASDVALRSNGSLVPWSSYEEWFDIRKKILDGTKESRKSALSRLRIWQLRCDSKRCPAFIEATIHLLRAFVADEENSDTSEVLSVYGEAINKFVQAILERAAKPGEGNQNKQAADVLNIPQWIVDVRNDAIHHFRGSLPLYRTTANTVFDWLKLTFWEQEVREKAPQKRPTDIAIDAMFQEYIGLALSAKTSTERGLAQAALENLKSCFQSTDPQLLVSHIIDLEALTSIHESRSTSGIPTNYKQAYLPVLALLGDNLTALIVGLLKTLSLLEVVCSDRNVDEAMRILVAWIKWIVSGNATLNGHDLATAVDLKKVLHAASTVISSSTMDLLEIIMEKMNPPLCDTKADFIRQLYVAFSGERAKTCDSNGFDTMKIATVEQVVAERANRDKLNGYRLPSTARVDWSVVPLGLLPDKTAVSNLYLDVDIGGDYVPLELETEDEAILEYERKFLEQQKQILEIRSCKEDLYENSKRVRSASSLKLWRNTQIMLEEQEDSSLEEYHQPDEDDAHL